MLKPEQVAANVVEDALDAFTHASGLGLFPDEDEEWREDLVNGMRAAIAAAINAWPEMVKRHYPNDPTRPTGIFLPLPTENSNAEG